MMNTHFATAIGRALEQTRAGNPMEATRLIQEALNENGAKPSLAADVGSSPAPRRPLGQTIDTLVSGRRMRALQPSGKSVTVGVPTGARFDRRTHACTHGSRDYRVFVPADDGQIAGLIIMLHGCTQTMDDFAVGTRMNDHAARENLVVVYPEQTRGANQMGCWNWFRPEDQSAGRGEPALLADLARTVGAEFNVPYGRTFVAGLSAGGAMAAILGVTHPEVFAATGVHSGLAPGVARDVASAFSAMRGQGGAVRPSGARPVRSIVFHGEADTTVAPSNADAVVAVALGGMASDVVQDPSTPGAQCTLHRDPKGQTLVEDWRVRGAPHAWSGGAPGGTYTYPAGPDASAEMVRFFLSKSPEAAT